MKKKLCHFFCLNLFVFQIAFSQPVINAITPSVGPVGSTVVISGSNFNATASLNIVYFGATKALVNNASANSLTVTVPFGANNFPVSVLNTANNLTAYSAQPFKTDFFCPSILTNSSLAAPVSFTSGISTGVGVADFDGDGKSDMANCWATGGVTGTVSVFRNIATQGTITNNSFAPKQDFPMMNPSALSVADIDGDGKLDIITVSYSSNNIQILRNNSTLGSISFAPVFTVAINASGPVALDINDLDMDGKPEIVVANSFPGKISVVKNNSTPGGLSFAASVDFTATSQPISVVIADIDGDGKKDIAAANTFSGICVYKNTTVNGIINLGSFAQEVHIVSNISPGAIAAADVDGDSKVDLMVSSALGTAVEVYRNVATGGTITINSFAAPITYSASGNCYSIMAADITGDGKVELLLACLSSSTLSILRNLSTVGNVNFSLPINYGIGGAHKYQAIGDMDNDGRNDVVINNAATNSGIQIFRNLMGFQASTSVTSVSCNGGSNGQVLLNAITLNTTSVIWSNSLTTLSMNNLVAGIYTYTLTSGTCILTQSVSVQQPAPINLTTSSSNSILCEGQTATLTVSGANSYSWTSGPTTATIAVSPSVTTNYQVTGTLNGCSTTATVTQVVSVFSLNASSSATLLCEGETATLSASGALTYTWAGATAGSGVAVTPSISTVYSLSANNSDGCLKTATLAVNVSACTKVNEEERLNVRIQVYPNPNTGQFYLELNEITPNTVVEIYNSTGQLIVKRNLEESSTIISNLNTESQGIYFIKVISINRVIGFCKIIKI